MDLNQTTTSNSLRKAQNSLNSGYDIDTSSVTALRNEIDTLLAAGASEEEVADLRAQLSEAEAAVDSAYAAMELSLIHI